MVRNKKVAWNSLLQDERGETSKNPMDDNPFAENLKNRDEELNRGANRDVLLDRKAIEDVLHIHPNDHTGLQLVAVPLTGNNFYTWSRSIKRALGARNKLDLINGNLLEPDSDSYYYNAWMKADYMVTTWILSALSKDLAQSFQYIDNSKKLWEEIQNRFDRSSGPKLYQLERDLGRCVQHNMSVMDYFNCMNSLWDEINILCPIPVCTCEADEAMRKIIEKRRVNQFLLGLNDSFDTVKSQILLMEPLPPVSRVYSMVLQDEDQRKTTSLLSYMTESAMLAGSSVNASNYRPNKTYTGSFRPRLSREERKKLKCRHCGENGHEMRECFKLHGYPDWFKELKEQRARQEAMFVSENVNYPAENLNSADNVIKCSNPGVEQVIKDEIERCFLKYSHNTKTDDKQENVNLISASADPLSAYGEHFAFGVTDEVSGHRWILDSGASAHICCDMSLLKDLRKLREDQKIFLPDGSVQIIEYAGSVQLMPQLILQKVLLAPSFTHNLISVSQLAKDLHVKCVFLETHCIIQKASNDSILGMAKASGKLYILNVNNVDVVNNVANGESLTAVDWHHRLGHLSITTMMHIPHIKHLCTQEMRSVIEACDVCHRAKQSRNPFPLNQHRSAVVDDHSRCTWTFLMSSKLQVYNILKDFIVMVKTQFGVAVKKVRSDNGSEFINRRVHDLFSDHGILHQRSCVYRPQQNGVVERKHRSLLQVARAVMFHSHLPARGKFDSRSKKCVMLGYTSDHKGYVLYDLTGKTTFISRDVHCFERIFPFTDSSDVESQPVSFHHDDSALFDINSQPLSPVVQSSSSLPSDMSIVEPNMSGDLSPPLLESVSDDISSSTTAPSCIALNKGKRISRPPSWTKDFVATCLNEVVPSNLISSNSLTPITFPYKVSPAFTPDYVAFLANISTCKEPMTYAEACKSSQWVEAMNCELAAIEDNGTWIIMDLPTGKTPIGSKWTLYKSGFLIPVHVASSVQLADFFTKCLGGPRFRFLLSKMGLVDIHQLHLEGGVLKLEGGLEQNVGWSRM